jgi:hypothetical protein
MANYLTQADVQNYGSDLLNVTQRAAMQAVEPHLQNLEAQNNDLRQRLAREQRHRLDQQVAAAVPNYQEIDRDPRWHQWLLEPDEFTGRPRQLLLNDAVASGNVSRVKAFFQGFQRAIGGSQNPSASQRHARSARSGKPVYTREQIGKIYEARRKGAYAGREAEWARQEADIFDAQKEGRVQGVYLTK